MLRHRSDFSDTSAVNRARDPCDPVPRVKEPHVVTFERQMTSERILQDFGENHFIKLHAAPAAGKTTVIPLALAQATGKVVFHAVPSAGAVYDVFKYMRTRSSDVHQMDGINDLVPESGVVLMTYAYFCARFFKDEFKRRENIIFYLDEIHDNDCYLGTLRALCPSMPMFDKVVFATATPEASTTMRDKPPVKVDLIKYPVKKPQSWSVEEDVGMPWHCDEITENTMILNDHFEVAEQMVKDYTANGIRAYHVHCRSEKERWHEVNTLVRTDRNISVVIVDSSFRSAITPLGISRFVDSGEVAYPVVDDGEILLVHRDAYTGEMQQFRGRAGRLPGGKASKVFQPDKKFDDVIVSLTPVEAVASNLLFRMFGFLPPTKQKKYPFHTGLVPDDFGEAFSSDVPMSLYPEDRLVPWVTGSGGLGSKEKNVAQYGFRGKKPLRPVSCHTQYGESPVDSVPPPMPALPVSYDAPSIISDDFEQLEFIDRELPGEVSANAARFSVLNPLELSAVGDIGGKELPKIPMEFMEKVQNFSYGTTIHESLSLKMFDGCVYYMGIDKARLSRKFFDVEDVIRFTDHENFGTMVSGLRDDDRLSAIKLLVEAHNNIYTQYAAYTRFFTAANARPVSEWATVVDREKFIKLMKSYYTQACDAESCGLAYRKSMLRLAEQPFVTIERFREIEDRLIRKVVAKIDEAVNEVDDTKIMQFVQSSSKKIENHISGRRLIK